MSFILENIVSEKLWNIEGGAYFQAPVDRKRYKDYASIIESPMDLKTIKKNISRHVYQTCEHFGQDIRLIYQNSLKYNGEVHECTKAAANLVATMETALEAESEELKKLEVQIVTTQTQSGNDFLEDLKMSDDESEDDEGGELEDPSQEDHMAAMEPFSQDVVPMEEPETPQGYIPEGSSALSGLDLSESEDDAPPESDLQAAFGGPADLFGNMSSSDEE